MVRPYLSYLTSILLLAGSVPCLAGDPLAHLLACRTVPQAAAKLACFERTSAVLADGGGHCTANAVGGSAPSLEPSRTFGLPEQAIVARELTAHVRPKALSHVSSRISRITQTENGLLSFTLDNGQTWVELVPNHDFLAAPGDPVTISRQLFGSYWMDLSGRGCKVMRVR